jgi:hypothetical protein
MAKTGIVTRALRVESCDLVANGSFFLSLDTTPTGAENLRGGLHAFLWNDESKRNFGRGHLNPSFGDNIALVPWDKLAGAVPA